MLYEVVVVGMLIYLIIFTIYLEYSPNLGNIWIRVGSDGKKHFRPINIYHIIIKPLSMKELWYPKNWDLNFIVGSFFTILLLNILYTKK
jgi:hypothetical protein